MGARTGPRRGSRPPAALPVGTAAAVVLLLVSSGVFSLAPGSTASGRSGFPSSLHLVAGSAGSDLPTLARAGTVGGPRTAQGPWTFDGANYSLGLPGDSPSPLAFDPISGQTFVAEYPDYLAVVAPYPLNASSLVVVGSSPAAVAVVPADHEVFVANSGSNNVSVVSTLTLGLVTTIPVGDFPDAVAYDNATGVVAVANEFSLNVTLINATRLATVGNLPTGLEATALTYDPGNGEFYLTGALASDGWEVIAWLNPLTAELGVLTGFGGGNFIGYDPAANEVIADGGPSSCACFNPRAVSLVNASNEAGGIITVPETPQGLAFDVANGEMLVAVWDGSWTADGALYVLDPSNRTTTGSYEFPAACPQAVAMDPVDDLVLVANSCGTTFARVELPSATAIEVPVAGGGPDAALLDPLTGNLLVANEYSENLTVWNTSTHRAVGGIRVGAGPDALAFDSTTGAVYVANAASDNLTVVDGTNYSVLGSIPVGSYPVAIAYDAPDNELWVANYGSNNVSVVSGSTLAVLGTVEGEPGALSIVYDRGTSLVFVADSLNETLGVIRADDLSARSWEFVPGTPLSLAYDPAAAEIDVGEIGTAIVTDSRPALADRSAVELPSLLVRLIGEVVAVSDTTGAIEASPPAGEFPYAIALDAFTSEVLTANFFEGNVSVLEQGTLLPVTSIPVGSAPGALALGPTNGSIEVLNFGSDSLTSLTPARTLPVFLLNFTETGLPAGMWNVSLDGYSWSALAGAPIAISAVNGTYDFAVTGPAGYDPSPASGNVSVAGGPVEVSVTFAEVIHVQLYPVEFSEEGVCGLAWAVEFNGTLEQAFAGSPIVVNVTNGSYAFAVPPLFGCRGTPANGTVEVHGGAAYETIVYARSPAAASAGAGWGEDVPWILLLVAGATGVAAALAAFLSRPPPPPRSSRAGPAPPAAGPGP